MSKTTKYFNQVIQSVQELEHSTEEELVDSFNKVFKLTAEALATKNELRINECMRVISEGSQGVRDYLDKTESDLIKTLHIRINEYLYILLTYSNKNISYKLLDQIEEYPFSMLVLEKVRFSKSNFEGIVEDVLNDEFTEEDVDVLHITIDYLIDEGLLEEEEDDFIVSNKGEELFNSYSISKRMTNKYERIRRQQLNNRKATVNVELLNKIDRIPYGFKTLEIFYQQSNNTFTSQELSDELRIDNYDEILKGLVDLYLIDQVNDNEYLLLKSGESVFETYRKSKRYTNTYERVKRRS